MRTDIITFTVTNSLNNEVQFAQVVQEKLNEKILNLEGYEWEIKCMDINYSVFIEADFGLGKNMETRRYTIILIVGPVK